MRCSTGALSRRWRRVPTVTARSSRSCGRCASTGSHRPAPAPYVRANRPPPPSTRRTTTPQRHNPPRPAVTTQTFVDWAKAEVKASTISMAPVPAPASEPATTTLPSTKRSEDWLAKPVENAARFQSAVKEAKEGKAPEDEEAAKRALLEALKAQDKQRAEGTEAVVVATTETKTEAKAATETSSSSSPTAEYLQNLSIDLAEANLDTEKVLEEVTSAMGQLKNTKMMTEVVPQVSRGATTPRTHRHRRPHQQQHHHHRRHLHLRNHPRPPASTPPLARTS